jgi:flagellar assembly protein FliH
MGIIKDRSNRSRKKIQVKNLVSENISGATQSVEETGFYIKNKFNNPQSLIKGSKKKSKKTVVVDQVIMPKKEVSEPPPASVEAYIDNAEAVDTANDSPSQYVQKAQDISDFDSGNDEGFSQSETFGKDLRAKADDEIADYRQDAFSNIEAEKASAIEQGYKEGYAKGLSESENKINQQSKELGRAINELFTTKDKMLGDAKPILLKLAIKISEEIVQKELKSDEKACISMLDAALSRITDKDNVTIRVHTKDLAIVNKHKDKILDKMPDIRNLQIQEDKKLSMGGCVIETNLGYIDSSIKTQLESIDRAFQQEYEEELIENAPEEQPEEAAAPQAPVAPAPAPPPTAQESLVPETDLSEDLMALEEDATPAVIPEAPAPAPAEANDSESFDDHSDFSESDFGLDDDFGDL